jgi:hypothetical protein
LAIGDEEDRQRSRFDQESGILVHASTHSGVAPGHKEKSATRRAVNKWSPIST